MLDLPLIHPDILRVLGRAGHGSQVLIADGNYPFRTTLGPNAELVSLNLAPGIVSATDVLAAVAAAIPVEAAAVMATAKEGPYAVTEDPPIWAEFRDLLAANGFGGPLDEIERFAFYEAGRGRGRGAGHRHRRAAHLRQPAAHHRSHQARLSATPAGRRFHPPAARATAMAK